MRAFFREYIAALSREWRIAFLRWALREMHPLHPDVPGNVLRLNELVNQRESFS